MKGCPKTYSARQTALVMHYDRTIARTTIQRTLVVFNGFNVPTAHDFYNNWLTDKLATLASVTPAVLT